MINHVTTKITFSNEVPARKLWGVCIILDLPLRRLDHEPDEVGSMVHVSPTCSDSDILETLVLRISEMFPSELIYMDTSISRCDSAHCIHSVIQGGETIRETEEEIGIFDGDDDYGL